MFLKKGYKISGIPVKYPNSLKRSIEVHFSRSNIFPLYFYDTFDVNLQENLAEVLLIHAKKWFYRISSFYEKRIDTGTD